MRGTKNPSLPRLAGTLILLGCALALPARAQPAGPAVEIREVTFEKKALERPVIQTDAAGQRQTFNEVTIVQLKGVFPPPMGASLDLYIGDYKIPEYGTTRDGIYFKVYDLAHLARLQGKELRYRFGGGEIEKAGMRFQVGAAPAVP